MGYEKLNLTANSFVMSGIQFVNVGGDGATLSELFSATDIPFETEIRFLDESGVYQIYKYIEEAYDEDADDFVPGWGDGEDFLASDVQLPGQGFWVKAPETYSLAQAGQVIASGTYTVDVPSDSFMMIANPFPSPFNPNEVSWEGLDYDTEIRVLDSKGVYQIYKYIEEAYDEATDDFVPGWGDGEDFLVKDAIADSAQGFWIKAPKKVAITISNPTK